MTTIFVHRPENCYQYLLLAKVCRARPLRSIMQKQYDDVIHSRESARLYLTIYALSCNDSGNKKNLIADASQAIFFIQNAVYLGMATNEETTQLTPWKNYRLILSRIDTKNAREIDWSTP